MIKHRKIYYIVSGTLFIAAMAAFVVWGLKPAIDFTGGTLMEVEYANQRPPIDTIRTQVDNLGLGNVSIQPIGNNGLLLRLRDITDSEHTSLLLALHPDQSQINETRFDSIGPVIGRELTKKAWTAIALVVLMIIIFIAIAFRKVSRPVASWKYGVAAIAALIHDVGLPVGVFAVLGHFYNIEVDILFVTALLTILGFSVHDTIVVFDRARENLRRGIGTSFEDTVEKSLRQVMGRSVKTSLAILLVLFSLFIFGGDTTKYFTLTLILGIIFGTYSSLFIASPLLVTWQKWQERDKRK